MIPRYTRDELRAKMLPPQQQRADGAGGRRGWFLSLGTSGHFRGERPERKQFGCVDAELLLDRAEAWLAAYHQGAAALPESHRVHRRGRPDRLMSCGQMWSDQHPVAGKVGRSEAAERQRLNPEQDQIDAMEPFMRRVAADLDPGIWALSEAKASAGRAAVGAALGQLFLGLAEQELEDGREIGQFFIELPEDPAPHVEQLLDYLGERFIPITVVTAVEAAA